MGPEDVPETPLSLAVLKGKSWDDNDMIDLLLKESAGDSIKWHLDVKTLNRAFLHAFSGKNVHLMEVLLARGAEVNSVYSNGRSALMIAAKKGDTEIARFLLNANADVNQVAYWATPLICASRRGHLEMVDLLLSAGADVNVTYSQKSNFPFKTLIVVNH